MKTLKAIAGLVVGVVAVVLVEALVTLQKSQRNSEIRRQVYDAIRNDLRTLVG